ncbi:hypothetical protein [Roseovarius sp. 2305UL8-3]|uniref:hypothetical protein n=1 Tax=Roseovarius conchicola TaxID=3121636 RepID=UPI0035291CA8
MFAFIFTIIMLVVVPTVVLGWLSAAGLLRRITLALAFNFAGVFLATMIGLLLVYEIEMDLIGRSLGLDPDGIWPLEGTPEQEAYIQRRVGDAWKVMSIPFSLILATVHSIVLAGLLVVQRGRRQNPARQKS